MPSILNSISSHIPNSIPDALHPFTSESSPFASHPKAADPAASTDLVWLLDNTASLDPDNPTKWKASFVAAFFAHGTEQLGRRMVSHIIEELQKSGLLDKHVGSADQIRGRVEQRVLPFFREVVEGRSIDVRIRRSPRDLNQDQGTAVAERTIGPSDSDGVARDEVDLIGSFSDGEVTRASAAGGVAHVPAFTTYASPTGWAVISDIDDTIKVTLTDHVAGILKTTFLDTPRPIAGMPELYRDMKNLLDNPPFWYLSASPYNLYQFLHEFRDQYYPRGTLELRNASWQNVSHFLSSVNKGTEEYKVRKMEERIHRYWPNRKVVCIGDSKCYPFLVVVIGLGCVKTTLPLLRVLGRFKGAKRIEIAACQCDADCRCYQVHKRTPKLMAR